MEKTALNVRTFGDPVLRLKARKVGEVTDDDRALFSKMAQTMYASSGIGLAAPQVGVSRAMIVVDIGSGLYKLADPKIVESSGRQAMEEGCLSVPGVCVKVRRARRVTVKALDDEGKAVTIEAEDLLACVLQHELDHLKGRLIVDYASFLDKLKMKKRLASFQGHASASEPQDRTCQLHL